MNKMQYFLYILKSAKIDRYYIGITADTEKRLARHNNGQVKSTKAYHPWNLVYNKIFPDKTSARQAEIHLKKNYRARKDLFDEIDKI